MITKNFPSLNVDMLTSNNVIKFLTWQKNAMNLNFSYEEYSFIGTYIDHLYST